jgi:hypothetical protein
VSTLIFIITFLFFLLGGGVVGFCLLTKRIKTAKKILLILLSIALSYFAILLAFSLTSISTILPMGEDKCFDEWCAAVIRSTKQVSQSTTVYYVTMRISNHGRGRAQKPDHPEIYVVDEMGHRYDESLKEKEVFEKQFGAQRPIDSRIEAQSQFESVMVFSVPLGHTARVVITEGGFPTPLIIGDEGSFLHKKSGTLLD